MADVAVQELLALLAIPEPPGAKAGSPITCAACSRGWGYRPTAWSATTSTAG
jgi:hypothetical protein